MTTKAARACGSGLRGYGQGLLALSVSIPVCLGLLAQLPRWLAPAAQPDEPSSIALQLIELPPLPPEPAHAPTVAPAHAALRAPQLPQAGQAPATRRLATAPPEKAQRAPVSPAVAPPRAPALAPPPPAMLATAPAAPAASAQPDATSHPHVAAENQSSRNAPPSAGPANAQAGASDGAAAAAGNSAARPLAQPLPEVPDDLRELALSTVALARLHIHVDGTVTVELLQATPDPRLNQRVLQTLRNWRFVPARQDGHAVASELDVRVHFNVN